MGAIDASECDALRRTDPRKQVPPNHRGCYKNTDWLIRPFHRGSVEVRFGATSGSIRYFRLGLSFDGTERSTVRISQFSPLTV